LPVLDISLIHTPKDARMPKLHQIIERHWQRPNPFLSFLLKPLSKLFAKIAAKRRDDFVSGRLKSEKLPVPVVVVGNIHAGGTGKTPIVAALVSGLQEKDIKVGIISRGYGRKRKAVHVLNAESRAEDAGDEPLLLFRKTGAPTAVGSSRAEAGRALLAAHPDIGLIVADDGLQHYALRRDVEIAVFPAADTGRTDLDLLPNGSLREPLSRLDSVDAVVVSGGKADASFAPSENMFNSKIRFRHRSNRIGAYWLRATAHPSWLRIWWWFCCCLPSSAVCCRSRRRGGWRGTAIVPI